VKKLCHERVREIELKVNLVSIPIRQIITSVNFNFGLILKVLRLLLEKPVKFHSFILNIMNTPGNSPIITDSTTSKEHIQRFAKIQKEMIV
jgi:hypothetical protein